MTLYILLFFICFIMAIYQNSRSIDCFDNCGIYRQNSRDTLMVCVMLVVLACISGFRYEMGGTDYIYYEYFYNKIKGRTNLLNTIINSEFEIGYTTFVYLCSNILKFSYNGSLVIEAFIFYGLMYIGLKKYIPNWGIFLMFFLYKMFFYVSMVAMRQAFTVAGFFVVMRYLEERNIIKYYATLILVSTFHYGAILLFVLYPLFGLKYTKDHLKTLGICFGISTIFSVFTSSTLSFVVSVLGLSQLKDKAAGYSADASLHILYTIEYFMLYILLVYNYDEIKRRFEHADFVINLFIVVLPIVTLFRSIVILVRELPYFYPAYAILIYYICTINKHRLLIYSAFSMACLIGILKYIFQFDNGHFLEYRTWICNPYVHFFQQL